MNRPKRIMANKLGRWRARAKLEPGRYSPAPGGAAPASARKQSTRNHLGGLDDLYGRAPARRLARQWLGAPIGAPAGSPAPI